jgi:4-methyl-5(b-hydroxyethyl)-thiazole monophosphate biosynthesis
VILTDGFEDMEAVAPIDVLRRAGLSVTTVGTPAQTVVSSHGVRLTADRTFDGLDASDLEMLVLPGGPGVEALKRAPEVLALLRDAVRRDKPVGAICAAPSILAEQGFLAGRRATCFPGYEDVLIHHGAHVEEGRAVVQDGSFITARAAGSAVAFALHLTAVLRGRSEAEKVRAAICYETTDRRTTR